MQVSEHFTSGEFACKCCGKYIENSELLFVLEDVRKHFGTAVTITSGTRCAKHNKEVGGAPLSQHVLGTAADIKVKGITPVAVAQYLELKYPKKYGVGVYKSWTHVDVRTVRARWKV